MALTDEDKMGFSDSQKQHPQQSHSENARDVVFWSAVGMSQLVGVIGVCLAIYWANSFGGFSWTEAGPQFNWHPVLMVLGLVFFYGDAMIVYRALPFLPKLVLKLIHAGLHICAILFSSIALIAVLENHRKQNRPDFYSLHSWVGIGTFALFCLQYIGSFVTFLYPGLPNKWRSLIMPFHTFFGVGLFALAVATSLMGLTEKMIWTPNFDTLPYKVVLSNTIGLLLIVFAGLIIYVTTHGPYKRRTLPNELPPVTTN